MSEHHRSGSGLVALLVALGLAAALQAPATSADETGTPGGAIDRSLAFCDDHSVPANDDYWTAGGITPPFPLTFFGATHTSMFVNNNGNVTFGSGLEQYTPSVLSGGTQYPIIAPFFADFDTSAEGSGLTTYGSSPDGKTFCAQWIDLGYYQQHMDKTNSVQLLLRSTQDLPGRSPGDFDITFNYDRISWESGDAPGTDGVDGLGGRSAVVGYSASHGLPGSAFQMTGSFVNGAFLDGGPNALVSGSHGSTQPGRYVFEVRNAGFDLTPESTTTSTPTPAPTVPVAKKSSSTTVKVPAKGIRAGGKVRVRVKVTTAPGGSTSGSVLIKDGKKVVKKIRKLSKSGKAAVTLKRIKRGKHKIKAVFSGNSTTLRSTSRIVRFRAS